MLKIGVQSRGFTTAISTRLSIHTSISSTVLSRFMPHDVNDAIICKCFHISTRNTACFMASLELTVSVTNSGDLKKGLLSRAFGKYINFFVIC
jgi:hypothetical protein